MATTVNETKDADKSQLEEANKIIGALETKLQTLEIKLTKGKTFSIHSFTVFVFPSLCFLISESLEKVSRECRARRQLLDHGTCQT